MFSPAITQSTILQCLTDIEISEFLPGPMLGELCGLSEQTTRIDPTDLTPETWAAHLKEADPEILVACWATPPLPADLPPNLRYVCYLAGSVKKLVSRQQIEDGLIVTNWGHSISRTVAEGALLHVLSCLRGASYWAVQMHNHGAWKKRTTQTASLFGRRVGVRGYGRVARAFIELLRPFNCDVGVLAPDVDATRASQDNVRVVASLHDLMRDHDVVVELAPLIPETRRSIKEEHLKLLRPGGIFVNVGRGATVDEAALESIVREGKISAGLDVFSQEPLPADSGFRGLSNVSLTPHLAGPTTDRRPDAGNHGLKNLKSYLKDGSVTGRITLPIYDHST